MPDWHQAPVYVLIYITHEISHMYGIEMAVCVTFECHIQAYTSTIR